MHIRARWLRRYHAWLALQQNASLVGVGCPDAITRLLQSIAKGVRSIAPDQAAQVHQPDTIRPLSLVQIRRRYENGQTVFHQLIQNHPELAAPYDVPSVVRL